MQQNVWREDVQSRGKILGVRWVDSQEGEHSEDENGGARVCLAGVTATTCSPPPRRSWPAHLFSLTLHIGAKVVVLSRIWSVMDVRKASCTATSRKRICIELLDETCGRRKGWVGEADQGDVWDSLDVAEGRAGEDEGTRTPLVRDGSALVPSSWQRCVRGRSRGMTSCAQENQETLHGRRAI